MSESIKTDGADKRWWDCESKVIRTNQLTLDRPLFATRSGRWRMSQVLMISIFGQFSGNGLTYFNTQVDQFMTNIISTDELRVIYAELGVNTVPQQLGYNILSNATQAISAITGALLMDRLPRRGVLIWCTFGKFSAVPYRTSKLMARCGVLACYQCRFVGRYCHPGSQWTGFDVDRTRISGNIVSIFRFRCMSGILICFSFLFNCLFAFSYTPLQAIVPVEALDSNMRAKGMAAMQFIVSIIGFINTYAIPISLHNIG